MYEYFFFCTHLIFQFVVSPLHVSIYIFYKCAFTQLIDFILCIVCLQFDSGLLEGV